MKEINHHIWDLQYEANQDKGYKDSINFRDAFLNEIFVKKGIVHTSLFSNTKFINKALNLNTNNLWIKSDENLAEENFIASFSSAPLDQISLQNTIAKEYVDLIKTSKTPFSFSIIHLLPLDLRNDDNDIIWVKKIGDIEIRKKLDTWLSNKNPIYLQNTLNSFTQKVLYDNNITNNFDKPIFLISNVDIDIMGQVKVIDYINVYVGLIDDANKIFTWHKVSRNFFVKRNRHQYFSLKAMNPNDFDIDNLKIARNVHLEFNSFTLYHQYENTEYFNLFAIYRDYGFSGVLNQWSFNRDSIRLLNNKKLPEYIIRFHDFLFKWANKIQNKK